MSDHVEYWPVASDRDLLWRFVGDSALSAGFIMLDTGTANAPFTPPCRSGLKWQETKI
jgi:hypothetical protein